MNKLTSRKFWISVGGCLASIAVAIEGMHLGSETIADIGIVCAVISAAIYVVCEALVDAANASAEIVLEDGDTLTSETGETYTVTIGKED